MTTILTSSTGYFKKSESGQRIPDKFFWYNGFLDKLHNVWVKDSKVLIIAAAPKDYVKNDDVCQLYKQVFELSGLSTASVDVCDARNAEIVNRLNEIDVILLSGGHVPSQNAFFKAIGLKEKLGSFDGLIIAWSAGSMNCADTVYAGPELDGEAVDPHYERWISGLGLTNTNIFPHFQNLRDEWLDGMRLLEDITFADSFKHEIIAMNDGTYIVIEDGRETLFGEAYSIKDGTMRQICENGMSIELN